MGFISATFLAACLIATAMAQPTQQNEQALRTVTQSANQFGNDFLQHVSQETPGNLITSPLSADLVLAMAAYGARGRTEQEFRQTLRLPQPDSLAHAGFRSLIDDLNTQSEGVTLSVANKVFLNTRRVTPKPTYIEITREVFRSTVEAVDFSIPPAAAKQINSWVKEQTRNRITDIVQEEDLSDDTGLVLVNAVYFKGLWKYEFNRDSTSPSPFYVDGRTVKNVPTMHRKLTVRYGESKDLGARFVELPYKGDKLSMVIIVPYEVDGLAAVENKLQNVDIADLLNTKAFDREINLSLPKFKIESKIELNDILRKLGLVDMFERTANFTGISERNNLYVSKAVQKAFIEVNEEGSEAAAVTGLLIMSYSLIIPTDVTVDRPFFYAIVKTSGDQATGTRTPLFTGHVVDPTT